MTKPTIRRATAEDVPAIAALLADDALGKAREAPGDPCYAEAFAAIDADPNQFLAVVDDGGEVAGCLQLSFIPGLSLKGMWRGQIESVRIAASRRGQGLGHVMIDWAIAECRRRGCGLVQLTMNKTRKDSHRFYESLGFEATHEGFKLIL
ncbi:GNAT family N-acetyltransferase [Pelagibius marinus]|uniref:GNAT family N-acetyltransferase n=1 Tax=Pelagibius marinus TaxID=2762760 RepID=UPI0018731C97|nr:GNAT family N-acetyltransferase [Pelagibius marinus]